MRPIILAVAFLPFFANALLYIGLPPLLDLMAADLPMSHAARGGLMGMVSLASLLTVLYGGRLVDRRGGRAGGLLACALTIPGGLLSAGGSYGVVLAGRALVGAGGLLSMVTASRAVGRLYPRGRDAVPMGFFHAVFPVAAMVAFSLFRGLGESLGWRAVVLGTTGVSVAGLILFAILYVEEGPPSVGAGAPPGTLREALRLPGRFWALTALWLVYGVTGGTVNTFGAAFLAETGLDPLRADRVITWSMLGVVPATPLLGWWVDRHGGLHGLLTVCGLLAGLVLGLLVCRCTEPEPLGVLYGAVLAGIPLAVFLLLPRWVGPARVGLGFALVQGAMSIGALLGPVLAGVLRDRTGTHGWGMRLGVVLVTLTGVIGAGLWIRCGREGRSPPRGPGIARPLDGS